jgi:putative ABC transport system substrate-binding protein
MRRRDFAIGLLLAAATRSAQAQAPARQHRIAIVIPAGLVVVISETSSDSLLRRLYQPFFEELRRLGDVEGQNLIVERYYGEGHPERFADLAREIASRNPEVIVASTNPVARAVRALDGTVPIVWIGVDPIAAGLVTSLARPGGTSPGSASLTLKPRRSACRSSRTSSPRHPRLRIYPRGGRGKMPVDRLCSEHFRKSADDWNCR